MYAKYVKKIYCSNCGNLVQLKSNFCGSCGAPVHGAEALPYHAKASTVKPGTKITAKSAKKKIKPSGLDAIAPLAFSINYIGKTSILLPAIIMVIYFEPTVGSLLAILFFGFILLIALLSFLNFHYSLNDEGLTIGYGIIFKKSITVPYDRIQNVNIEQSLIDRLLGLSRVSVETAGSSSGQPINVTGGYVAKSEGYIPALSLESAKTLHDILVDKKLSSSNGGL